MAVAAVQQCLMHHPLRSQGLFFATTTAPYQEKQSAAIIASAVQMDRHAVTSDITNSLRAGTTALRSALDAVAAGSADSVLVVASDCRLGAPKGMHEQLFGDAAACLAIGRQNVIAEVESSYCSTSEFTGAWRTAAVRFVKSGEGRFVEGEGYQPIMIETISGLLEANSLQPDDFSKIVFPASDSKSHAKLAGKLGFKAGQIQDPLLDRIGNAGAAGPIIMLCAAMGEVNPGDRILLANYGDGADAFVLRVTQAIRPFQASFKKPMASSRSIQYGTYLNWRNLMQLEAPSLPSRGEPSLSSRWRERQVISTLSGVKCKNCGLPQIHTLGQTIRICIGLPGKRRF